MGNLRAMRSAVRVRVQALGRRCPPGAGSLCSGRVGAAAAAAATTLPPRAPGETRINVGTKQCGIKGKKRSI